MSDTLANIESMTLEINPDTPVERIAEVDNRLAWLEDRVAEMRQRCKASMMEWIETNKQDIVIGSIRHYIGIPPKTACNDAGKTLHHLIEHEMQLQGTGDLTAACEAVAKNYLGSSAWKYGAIREAIREDDFNRLFTVTREPKLLEGKVVKQLQKADTRFLKGATL